MAAVAPAVETVPSTTTNRRVTSTTWLAVAVAVLGTAGTMVGTPFISDTDVYAQGPEAVFAELTGGHVPSQTGAALLYATALCLLLLRPRLTAMLRNAAPAAEQLVDRIGATLDVAAATVTIGAVFKSILTSGLPGGVDADFYSQVDVAVLYTISGQLQFGVFVPLVATIGLTAVLVFRHGGLPRWLGALSAFLAVVVCAVTVALGLPWSAGLVTPIWMFAMAFTAWRGNRRQPVPAT
ncbi:hypothetical protein [Euzebya pacifica]|jgi:hypothetical protein|uniref:hypothetical protein n=1 Tax=Euzebya pacifica TaxID=1608957 RepID=UPI0030FB5930